MFSAIQKLCRLIPKDFLKTFTSDIGKEFACYPLVEELEIDSYFADGYSSWQRGLNEHSNRLLRRSRIPRKSL